MSDHVGAVPEGVTAGMLLRHARESSGLHVASLAGIMKVPVSRLEALEADRYEELPDIAFARALASSICRTLKVDPAPVMERLPQKPRPSLTQAEGGINEPFRAPSDGPAPGLLQQVTRPVGLTVVALLLGAVVLIFLPFAQRGSDTASEPARPDSGTTTVTTPVTPGGVESPAATAGAAAGLPPLAASAAGPAPTASAATQVPEVPASAASTPRMRTSAGLPDPNALVVSSSGPVASASPAASPAADAKGIIEFRARAPSWVEVREAGGNAVLQRTLQAGEIVAASGTPPLAVTVGSVLATQVQVRGKPFDLAPLARDNVARFEVK
jgi:cytoskeleton protein RodZ